MNHIEKRRGLSVKWIFFIGLLLSISVFMITNMLEYKGEKEKVKKRIDFLTSALQKTTNRYLEVMRIIGDFYDSAPGEIRHHEERHHEERHHE